MVLIVGGLILAITGLVGWPLINVVVDPLFVDEKSRSARLTKAGVFTALILLVTWPVFLGPLLFKFQCNYMTKLDVSTPVDARSSGYLDDRLSKRSNVETRSDIFYLNRAVDDIEAGRIAFFEKEIPHGYMRYSLAEAHLGKCDPPNVGANSGRPFANRPASTKCIATDVSQTSISRYAIITSGDLNVGDGTTKLVDKLSNNVVGMLRSFSYSFISQGSCGNVRVAGDDYSGHVNFTKMMFLDSLGNVARPILPK